ncbi:hypothetical protein LG634_19885 [Streptomyces bambusae]|uniref:hypothetical protein n=1 Tax=Streptomyces bambusae TaxID=1550616 RepID=UPI001CFD2F7F|nr:hypothetical protein [Streptomyces bambusae]MCB5167089.1 hypothetical protein [Streptomyces bambusae]
MQPSPRPALGAAVLALVCGALLCAAGWYGVSGERFAERQIPYLASCTVPGAALLVAGAVLLTAVWRPAPPGPGRPAEPLSAEGAAGPPRSPGPPLRVPGGTLAHRPDCPLVDGRTDAVPAAGDGGLSPCPVCEPAWPG